MYLYISPKIDQVSWKHLPSGKACETSLSCFAPATDEHSLRYSSLSSNCFSHSFLTNKAFYSSFMTYLDGLRIKLETNVNASFSDLACSLLRNFPRPETRYHASNSRHEFLVSIRTGQIDEMSTINTIMLASRQRIRQLLLAIKRPSSSSTPI